MIVLIISILLKTLAIVVPLLISVAYFTIAERKIMGIIQRRKGPNVIVKPKKVTIRSQKKLNKNESITIAKL